MTTKPGDLDGYLGMILGATVAGLRRSGSSPAEVRHMVEMAFKSFDLMADAAIQKELADDE